MRIAYILYPEAVVLNKANGIRNQALKWATILEANTNAKVDLISTWDSVNWDIYDIIHIFGGDQWLGFISDLRRFNSNVVFSPILDSITPLWQNKLLALLGVKGYHHAQNIYKHYVSQFKSIFVRSLYEGKYFSYCYGISDEKLKLVPISHEIPIQYQNSSLEERENFCLHISTLYQGRKNVLRLIEAAKKFHFELVLCGSIGGEGQGDKIYKAIENCKFIKYLGFISDEELISMYQRTKVFALPSINEGVGIVALNAGVCGANVVITKNGGPREYFHGLAYEVNPYSIDSIGRSVIKAMNDRTSQPKLREHLLSNFSEEAIANKLYNAYQEIVRT